VLLFTDSRNGAKALYSTFNATFLFRMMINNGSKHLVVVAVGFSIKCYMPTARQELHLVQIKIKYFVLFQFGFSHFAT